MLWPTKNQPRTVTECITNSHDGGVNATKNGRAYSEQRLLTQSSSFYTSISSQKLLLG